MTRNWAWSCCLIGLSVAPAYASFELTLVADNGSGTFATRTIHRFDGDTGVYLGKFGGFASDIIGTHLDTSSSRLFVMTSDFRTAEYNYNTGAHIRTTFSNFGSPSQIAVRSDGTRAAHFSGGANPILGAFPNGGTPVSLTGFASGFMLSGVWASDTRLVGYDVTGGRVGFWNINPGGLSGSFGGSISVGTFAGTSQMTSLVNLAAGEPMIVHPVNGQINFYYANSLSWGFITTTGVVNRHSSQAHDGFFTMGQRAGIWSLDKYDSTVSQRGQFGSGIVMNPASMQTVVAPEPGTMAALGLGLAAILRRRKASRA